jgi:hypothetical protein
MFSIGWVVMSGGIAGRKRERNRLALPRPATAFNIHAMDIAASSRRGRAISSIVRS